MRRILVSVFLIFGLLNGASPARAADDFLSVIEDIPVMSGLKETAEDALSFETAEGRIASTSISGPVGMSEVWAFYRSVLPQFGWQAGAQDTFSRDLEVLKIEIDDIGNSRVRVRFWLSPKPG